MTQTMEMTRMQGLAGPTKRWTPLRYHPEQHRLWHSDARFCVIAAGRRSGKTEIGGKRKPIKKAFAKMKFIDSRYAFTAPTYSQAKLIFWNDLKRFIPISMLACRPSESELTIKLVTGTELFVAGMDKPERLEGPPLDGIVITEFANIKPSAWMMNVRPALSDRNGWAIIEGVPEGRNHFYNLSLKAGEPGNKEWDYFHWISADILPPEEIEAAKNDLDELTYRQEYEASFLNFEGQAYYGFSREDHASEELKYNPNLDLIICFDFNVSPGIAVICQEQVYKGKNRKVSTVFTAIIGEVWIEKNSNTRKVCQRIIADWGHHKGRVLVYGDATGGAKGSAKVEGSDWDLIKESLRPVFGKRMKMRVPKGNPRERVRINAVNTRLRTIDGTIKTLVCPARAPHVATDFEGVVLRGNGSGEIDKQDDPMLTHLTDAWGYFVVVEHPISSGPKSFIRNKLPF